MSVTRVECVQGNLREIEILQRRKRKTIILVIAFFTIGSALLFGSMFYFVIALRSTYGGDSMETVDFVRSYHYPWLVLTSAGSSLIITAFALTVYWAYLRYKIRTGAVSVPRRGEWKILEPKE